MIVRVHGDCLKKLERRLPRSCLPVFNNQATKNSPNKVLAKSFDRRHTGINKDFLRSLCGCECGQGFLVKGFRAKKKKKGPTKKAFVRPSSKTSRAGVKMKRKPRLRPIEKRCPSSLVGSEVILQWHQDLVLS